MRKYLLSISIFLFVGCSNNEKDYSLDINFIVNQLEFCSEQYKLMSDSCPDSLFPKTFESGKLVTSASNWWCSGFFPGGLAYLYEYTGDQFFSNQILNRFNYLEKEKLNNENHDTGFKINCSFGNMLRITKDTTKYRPILIDAANTLLTRYNPNMGLIRSWDNWKDEWMYAVIIDNMMNLELLLVATELSGDSIYYNAALSHSDKTLKNHFREDFSSYHVVSYDSLSGQSHLKETHQGSSDESAWARGQAWGLYGFTMMYQLTDQKRYLETAIKIADFYLNHPNLPTDLIPYWDFNSKNIPNDYRDASAAAISASAFITLSQFSGESGEKYFSAANKIIKTLSSPTYKAMLGENGNFILKHGVGHLPNNSEIDVPLSYADYYYIESLIKLYALKKNAIK